MTSDRIDDDDRTTAIGLSRYAYEYLEAAILVDNQIGQRPGYEIVAPIPALYLAGHAIELSLKAYMRYKGITVRKLRTYGHDLHSCYRKTKELGLHEIIKPHVAEEGALELLSELYSSKELNYIRTGVKHFPSFALVKSFAVALQNAIGPHVGFNKILPVEFQHQ